ncbi:hypothetical protein WG66_016486, partial [Moniliophthora roreri]
RATTRTKSSTSTTMCASLPAHDFIRSRRVCQIFRCISRSTTRLLISDVIIFTCSVPCSKRFPVQRELLNTRSYGKGMCL